MACVKLILCSILVLAICHIVLTEDLKPSQGKGPEHCKKCANNTSKCNVVGQVRFPISNTIFQCECKTGYEGNGTYCENVNECEYNLDNCDNNAKCIDNDVAFSCECNPGWVDKDLAKFGAGVECVEVDECNTTTVESPCGDTGTCVNKPGSYSCDCASGYQRHNTTTCENIDECSEITHNCDVNAACTDNPGSYNCTCNNGYTGNGTYCNDIDECQVNNGDCGENTGCNNTVGSFLCSCKVGFQWNENKTDCIDIDECKDKTLYNCGEHEVCKNTVGSYDCPCADGYEKDSNGTCVNINECTVESHLCHTNATCQDTEGSYSCNCNDGFNGDGFDCEDINECTNNTHKCDKNGKCINTVGNYTCECIYSYTGDGYNCSRAGRSNDDLKNQAAELAERQTLLKIHSLTVEWQQLQIRNEQLKRHCAIKEQGSVSRQKREILPKVNQNDMQTYIKALEIHISDLKLQNHLLLVKCPGENDEIFG